VLVVLRLFNIIGDVISKQELLWEYQFEKDQLQDQKGTNRRETFCEYMTWVELV
jgi:hypothetical protein